MKPAKNSKWIKIGQLSAAILGFAMGLNLMHVSNQPLEVVNVEEHEVTGVKSNEVYTKREAQKVQKEIRLSDQDERSKVSEIVLNAKRTEITAEIEDDFFNKMMDIATSSKDMAERTESELFDIMYVSHYLKEAGLRKELPVIYETSNWVFSHAKGIYLNELKIDEDNYDETITKLKPTALEQWNSQMKKGIKK